VSLSDLRARVISEAGAGTTQSSEFTIRLDEFINRALNQMCLDAPNRFFEDQLAVVALPDTTPTLTTDLLTIMAGDPFVFSSALGVGVDPAQTTWLTDGTWDGRQIEIQGADKVWRKNRIRSVWVGLTGGVAYYKISLWVPWINNTETGANWRVADESIYLPDDMVTGRAFKLDDVGNTYPIQILGQMEAERLGLTEVVHNAVTGLPRYAFRRGHFQLPSPTEAPVASVPLAGSWVGPERYGKFRYKWTIAWGYQDEELQTNAPVSTGSASVFQEPRWESSPSPYVEVTVSNGKPITLTFPDIAFEQGFGSNVIGTERYRHSGYRIRIWRQRITSGAAALHADTPAMQSTPEPYLLIGELLESAAAYPTWEDDGSVTPAYHRRLRTVNGYTSLQLYPRPNERYKIDVRCVRKPQRLEDPYDAPPVGEEASDALVFKTLTYLMRQERRFEEAGVYEELYKKELYTLAVRYGDMRYDDVPMRRRIPRACRMRSDKRWYKIP
jgi:hypothetical protein